MNSKRILLVVLIGTALLVSVGSAGKQITCCIEQKLRDIPDESLTVAIPLSSGVHNLQIVKSSAITTVVKKDGGLLDEPIKLAFVVASSYPLKKVDYIDCSAAKNLPEARKHMSDDVEK